MNARSTRYKAPQQKWSDRISECRNSGKTVRAGFKEKGQIKGVMLLEKAVYP